MHLGDVRVEALLAGEALAADAALERPLLARRVHALLVPLEALRSREAQRALVAVVDVGAARCAAVLVAHVTLQH